MHIAGESFAIEVELPVVLLVGSFADVRNVAMGVDVRNE